MIRARLQATSETRLRCHLRAPAPVHQPFRGGHAVHRRRASPTATPRPHISGRPQSGCRQHLRPRPRLPRWRHGCTQKKASISQETGESQGFGIAAHIPAQTLHCRSRVRAALNKRHAGLAHPYWMAAHGHVNRIAAEQMFDGAQQGHPKMVTELAATSQVDTRSVAHVQTDLRRNRLGQVPFGDRRLHPALRRSYVLVLVDNIPIDVDVIGDIAKLIQATPYLAEIP